MRTRTLVLTTESARHPFRQRLPRHVLTIAAETPVPTSRKIRAAPSPDDGDWKLFMLSFSAFFTAFYSFIY